MFGTGKRSSVSFFFFCFFFFFFVVVVFSLRLFVPPPFFFASFRRFFSASRFFRFRFFRRALSFRSSSGVSPSPPSPQITGQNLSAAFQPLSFRPPCLMNLLRGSHSAHVGTSSVIVREHAVREEKKSVSEYVRQDSNTKRKHLQEREWRPRNARNRTRARVCSPKYIHLIIVLKFVKYSVIL